MTSEYHMPMKALYGEHPAMNGARKRTGSLHALTSHGRKCGIAYGPRDLWRRNPHSSQHAEMSTA